jgi:AraC family transcriptional regulator of adaptative response/methylated-DNA-[protein]-cysteine methyltransferase
MIQTETMQTPTESARWRAVLGRDRALDGDFVYAVSSTGIYCRPSCPSRRPKPENVMFYDLAEAAEQAGYRACRRCNPRDADAADPAVARIRRVCRYIEESETPPTLAALGAHVEQSPYHLQRTFKRVMGITPRQYADAIRLRRVKSLLKAGDDVAGALYEAGYGSSSRLYERAPSQLGMTPATYRKGGAGARMAYALRDCSLGRILVAATERGISFLAFGDRDSVLIRELKEEFPAAEIAPDGGSLGPWLEAILAFLDGAGNGVSADLPLDVRATAFQWRVWQELRAIPRGQTRTYREIAGSLGQPKAARAVGRACATNPVSLLVPCHRAVRTDGGMGGYRWGLGRKEALLRAEHAAGATNED